MIKMINKVFFLNYFLKEIAHQINSTHANSRVAVLISNICGKRILVILQELLKKTFIPIFDPKVFLVIECSKAVAI